MSPALSRYSAIRFSTKDAVWGASSDGFTIAQFPRGKIKNIVQFSKFT